MKHQHEWRPVVSYYWNMELANVVCRQLDCGSAVATRRTSAREQRPVWNMERSPCDGTESSLTECGTMAFSTDTDRLDVICSGNTAELFQ